MINKLSLLSLIKRKRVIQVFWLPPLLLAIGLALLSGASSMVISSIVAISEKRRLRKSVLSFFLVAFSTSSAELSVAVNSIILGTMDVSLGDILGSNITNIALIVGASIIVATVIRPYRRKITIEEKEKKEFTTGLMLISITLISLLYLQYISQIIGVILLCMFLGYSYTLIRKGKEKEDNASGNFKDKKIKKELMLFLAGMAGLLIGARLTIESTIDIATYMGIPSSIVAATLVAFGTSLPELNVHVKAAYKGHFEITLGGITGSCFFNSTIILGLLLVFTPFEVNLLVLSDLILFSVISNLLLWFFIENGKMGGREGLILLVLYTVNVLSLLGIIVLRAH